MQMVKVAFKHAASFKIMGLLLLTLAVSRYRGQLERKFGQTNFLPTKIKHSKFFTNTIRSSKLGVWLTTTEVITITPHTALMEAGRVRLYG
jgi:hypothetical protein